MASFLDKVFERFGYIRAPKTQPLYSVRTKFPGQYISVPGILGAPMFPRRPLQTLRNFSRYNEFVRSAINRRKHALAKANWAIVRTDDEEEEPKPSVVKAVTNLLRAPNPSGESFRSMQDKVVDDLLTLDAGCIEKELTAGGVIKYLWPVDGGSIGVHPEWDPSKKNDIRYSQYDGTKKIADLTNDELIYIMHNPTTYIPLGLSPVETLVRIIEAELYAEEYDQEMLKQTAPEGLLYLGAAITPEQVHEFRQYYQDEIAGTRQTAVYGGGGGVDSGGGRTSGEPKFIPFKPSAREAMRMEYKKWLGNKIAVVFEIDRTDLGLIDDVNRATATVTSQSTDEGLVGLANVLEEYYTREIVNIFDENHGFKFTDIVIRDDVAMSKLDSAYLDRGVITINEVRTREGLDEVEWGDKPYEAPTATPAPPIGGSSVVVGDDELGNAQGPTEPEVAASAHIPFAKRAKLHRTRGGSNYFARRSRR
jgi:hypothetical protein